MKTISTALALLSLASSASAAAFVPSSPSRTARAFGAPLSMAGPDVNDPELEKAIAEVRERADAFGEETAHFANMWIDKALEGKQEGSAAGVLEECLIDDDEEKCQKFEEALHKLDELLGVGAKEQF